MTEATAADSGAMSNAETAYFESGGNVTEGLDAPATETNDTSPPVANDTSPPVVATDDVIDNGADDKPEVGEDGKPKNKGQWVRYGALHAEREAAKALKAELATAREERARFDERLRILQEAMKEPEAAAIADDPEPDPEVDFIAHQKWVARQVKAEREARLKAAESQKVTQEHQRAESEVLASANADAVAFAKDNPDFGDAYNHLLSSRAAMYQSMGYANQEIHAQMRADEIAVYSRAKQRGVSAAELVYNLAKTVGYQKKAAAAAEDGDKATDDISKAIDQIEQINKGQAAAKTLSGAGGSPVQPLTAEALATMSNEEFNKIARRHPSEVKRLMGG